MRMTIVFIIGTALLAIALLMAFFEHSWLKRANITDGTVVELVRTRGSKGGYTYAPRVTYTAEDGSRHTFKRGYSSSPPGFKVGDQVAVAYQPATEKARILTFGQRYGFASIVGIVGAALLTWTLVHRLGNHLVPGIYLTKPLPPPVRQLESHR
jgi:hypothetical protein